MYILVDSVTQLTLVLVLSVPSRTSQSLPTNPSTVSSIRCFLPLKLVLLGSQTDLWFFRVTDSVIFKLKFLLITQKLGDKDNTTDLRVTQFIQSNFVFKFLVFISFCRTVGTTLVVGLLLDTFFFELMKTPKTVSREGTKSEGEKREQERENRRNKGRKG